MKAIPVTAPGAADSLKVMDWPEPKCSKDEILIDVKAFGINYADIMARKGIYDDAPPVPFLPGYEVAGVIKSIGENVQGFSVGQRVFGFVDFGGYAEQALLTPLMCFPIPEKFTFAQAASIPVNFITAYHSLYNTGILPKGSKVLIQAAAGGVGLAAVQMAKNSGCEIFGTAGSSSKLDLLREWGVDHPINYNTQDFVAEIKRITNNEGIDFAIDSIGGKSIKKCLSILRPNGRVIAMGVSALSNRDKFINIFNILPEVISMITLNSIDMLKSSKGLYCVNMNPLTKSKPEVISNCMKEIISLFEQDKLKTIISKEYTWDKIGQAHEELESRKSTGKIVIVR